MTIRTWMAFGTAGVLAMSMGCGAHQSEKPAPPVAATSITEEPGAITGESVVSVTSTVVKVDQKSRVVTLRDADGAVSDVHVGDEVKNLPQVKKGDQVVATYYESITITVRKPGEATPGITTTSAAERARPGEKPGGAVASQTTITATVTGIDKSAGTVTVKGPRGKTMPVKVRDPKRLEHVHVGDLVEATYTEAVAISVDKPATK